VVTARATWALGVVMLAAGPGIGSRSAQPATVVALKSTIGSPGSEIRVPLYLEPGEAKVASLAFRVSFPAERLTFVKLDLASRRLEPVAKVSRAVLVEGESSLLDVRLANEAEPIPAGPLGWLVFRVGDDVPVEDLTLGISRLSGSDLSGSDLDRLEGTDAKVLLITRGAAESVLACFFYMH
jgi:hypothetical protein